MTSLEQIAKGIKDYKDQSLTDEEKRREKNRRKKGKTVMDHLKLKTRSINSHG